ncbi:efflux RND transporter permease subunit [Flavobacterium sufflavum]|uniref:Efflux RND transporter permease subunit n=1 Tax=Flavobacterium sufflavum TaxID=1921138 RepID=A0A3S2U696_9FLAO|nr:efflux RND transporter permease subunit [Flavobacterium sufflavum]RVT79671.1 efflux RND transporter permease subunit [Flavobacterium sufflavum]
MSITELSIKRPLLITVIFVTLILFGWITYKQLDYNLLPKFEANVVSVQTVYRGASSDEIQNSVTKPVEEAVSTIEGVNTVSSVSQEGVSVVTIELKSGFDMNKAQRDAERKINEIKSKLPLNADEPLVRKFSTDEMPILRISVTGKLSDSELYDLVDNKIKPLIENVSGVGQVTLIGGNEREIQVTLDNDKLQSYGVSSNQVNQIIANSNTSYPAGSIESNSSRYSIRLDAKTSKVEDMRNLIIRENADGSRILLKDVAAITDTQTEPTTINRINGVSGIGIQINKQADANAVEVSQQVKTKLESIKQEFAKQGFNYVIAADQSVYTLASADAVMHDLFLAILIVGGVMLLFLHSLRSSMFVLVAIPSAMIPTFILMYVFGFSLNLMTLMGLSLVVGILVDDSIVVLENIYRHMEMGKDKVEASLKGRNEIGFTAMAITLVDVVVFVPLSFAGGLIGNILREFALVVVFSTLMSLFVSFTLTPLLASKWGKLEVLNKNTFMGRLNIGFEAFLDRLKESYGRILIWSLGHKRWILGGVFVLMIGSFTLLGKGFIGSSFSGNGDRGEFTLQLETSPQTPLYLTNQRVKKVEQLLLSQPEVVKVFTNVGTQSGSTGGSSSSSNVAELAVTLVDKEEREISTEDFGAKIRNESANIPGIKVSIMPTTIAGTISLPIQIAVKGTDMDSIWKAARLVRAIVAKTPGTDYVEYSTKNPKSEISIDLNRERVSQYGLTIPEVGNAVQLAFRGDNQTKYKESGEEYPVNLTLEKADRMDIDNVKQLTIKNNSGAVVRLDQVADVRETLGQAVLERTDKLNTIKVTSAAVGRPSGTIVADIQKKLETVTLPQGVTIDYLGDAKNQKEAFGSLGFAMLLGILLVYLIMVALYESVVYPFVVLFSIPVAIIGALLALALTMESLTIFAIVGLIMLLGLVAKNGILIVDFTNQLRSEGLSVTEALVEAGKERLRPILMTTIAMIVGMLPIALAHGAGAEVKNGMAWVIIGGLTSSLLLTLVLVPSMYMIIEKMRLKVNGWFSSHEDLKVQKLENSIEV